MDIVIKVVMGMMYLFFALMSFRKNNSIKENIEYKFWALVYLIISLNS